MKATIHQIMNDNYIFVNIYDKIELNNDYLFNYLTIYNK